MDFELHWTVLYLLLTRTKAKWYGLWTIMSQLFAFITVARILYICLKTMRHNYLRSRNIDQIHFTLISKFQLLFIRIFNYQITFICILNHLTFKIKKPWTRFGNSSHSYVTLWRRLLAENGHATYFSFSLFFMNL